MSAIRTALPRMNAMNANEVRRDAASICDALAISTRTNATMCSAHEEEDRRRQHGRTFLARIGPARRQSIVQVTGQGLWPLPRPQPSLFAISALTASRLKLAPRCIGGILEEGLEFLAHHLLDEHEAPELVLEPVEVLLRAFFRAVVGPAGALERIEAQVGDVGHVRMGLLAQPACGWSMKRNL